MNRTITIVIVLAVVAVGVVAAIVGVGEDSAASDEESSRDRSASDDLIGPHSPEPGALSGTLVIARGEECVVQLIDLDRMRFAKAGPPSGCEFVVAPDGEAAAVVSRGQETDDPMPMLELVELSDKPEALGRIGRIGRNPVWSPDGLRLGACVVAGSAETAVVDVETGTRQTSVGCWPSFGSDGSVVTRTAVDLTRELGTAGIHVDGDEVITLPQMLDAANAVPNAQAFVLGHTTGADGVIAVSLVVAPPQSDPKGSVQFWRAGNATSVVEAPLFLPERGTPGALRPEDLRDRMFLSPSGSEVAIVLEDGAGQLLLIDTRTGDVLGPLEHDDFDWSPDGAWFAVAGAGAGGIDVYGPAREDEPTYQIPLQTPALAWR